jgi:hypothetical protein
MNRLQQVLSEKGKPLLILNEFKFKVLTSNCATFDLYFNPKTVVTDFEQAIHFALNKFGLQ